MFRVKYIYFLLLLFSVSINVSCQTSKVLIINNPEDFSGWGAVVFPIESCDSNKDSIIIEVSKSGFGFSDQCFPNKDVLQNHRYYVKMSGINKRIYDLPMTDTINDSILWHNAGFFSSQDGYKILVYHIGKSSDSKEELSIESRDYFLFEEKLTDFIKELK